MNIVKKVGLSLLLLLTIGCRYPKGNNADLLGRAILNIQRGLNTVTVGMTLSCETDTPAIATKKITGIVKDFDSLIGIPNARISTDPVITTVTLTDVAGNFNITGIESTITNITLGATATGYDTLSQPLPLNCQNSVVTILMDKVKIAAEGVDAFTLDSSKLDEGNIQ